MTKRLGLKVLAISIALVIVASGVAMYGYSGTEGGEGISESEGGKGVISLVAPPFIGVAGAAEAAGGNAFPEDEAGISAYVNVNQSITLDQLEQLATIFDELEAAQNYVIGTISIQNFGGDVHPHIYADMDGWIVAYFNKTENASMIMQWTGTDTNNPNITEIKTTTLEDAINKSCSALGIDYDSVKPNIRYYDFEFPDANSMMLFVKTQATPGSGSIRVAIPDTDTLYEASYSHYGCNYGDYYWKGHHYYNDYTSHLKLDDTTINTLSGFNSMGMAYQQYDIKSTLTVGSPHIIEITYSKNFGTADDEGSAGVATVMVYKSAYKN